MFQKEDHKMERTVSFTVGGKEYPLNFSVCASERLAERFGSLEEMGTTISSGNTTTQLSDATFILHVLMDEGANREKILSDKEIRRFTFEDLKSVISVSSLNNVRDSVLSAITLGAEVEVEVEEAKNEMTTQNE